VADNEAVATAVAATGANLRFAADADYYKHLRPALLALADSVPMTRVLEIGCGAGETLRYLRQRGAQYTVGVEIRGDVAEVAKNGSQADVIIVGDIETLDLPFPAEHFDLVVASFVLEHVRDPWAVTRRLVSLLRPGGLLVGSLPNVRHWSVLAPLLFRGRWEYVDDGIMDWTHFRFFTRRTIAKLLSESGLHVDVNRGEVAGRKSVAVNIATLGVMSDFLAFAYNFRARKPS
jgi:SAM-dependent methyltransferase